MNLPNGGFPPIKNCIKTKEKNIELTKERLFPTTIKNINIRKILNSNIKKPLIVIEDNEKNLDDLEEV